MSDKLEQTMKKIHIYLANCKESTYSGEDIIVSRKRIMSLLEELNYAVYEVMEEYEATTAARDRGQAAAERMATDIKEDAMKRAEDIYAASLLYTQDAIADIRNAMEYTFQKTKTEYETLLANYEERLNYLESNAQEINAHLGVMADGKVYLRMVEEVQENSRRKDAALKQAKEEQEAKGRKIGSVASTETLSETEQDAYESKLTAPIVVAVHDSPKIPEGFGKGRGKKRKHTVNEATIQSQDLDAEYFAFQQEQEKELARQMAEEQTATNEEDALAKPLLEVIRRLSKSGRKKQPETEKEQET